jgi:hypothetical protein
MSDTENKNTPSTPAKDPVPAPVLAPEQRSGPEPHWIIGLITERWPSVKKFLVHIAFFAAGVIGTVFLYDHFIVHGLENDNRRFERDNHDSSEKYSRLQTENESLKKHISAEWWPSLTNNLYFTNVANPQLINDLEVMLPDAGIYDVRAEFWTTNTETAGVVCTLHSSEWVSIQGSIWTDAGGGNVKDAPTQSSGAWSDSSISFSPAAYHKFEVQIKAAKANTVLWLCVHQSKNENSTLLLKSGSDIHIVQTHLFGN